MLVIIVLGILLFFNSFLQSQLINNLHARLASVSKALELENARSKELTGAVNQYKNDQKALDEEKNFIARKKKNIKQKKQQIKEDREAADKKMKESLKEEQLSKERKEMYESEIKDLRVTKAWLTNQQETLSENVSTLTDQFTELKNCILHLGAEKINLLSELNPLRLITNESLERDYERLTYGVQNLVSQFNSLLTKKQDFENVIEKKEKKLGAIQRRISEAKQREKDISEKQRKERVEREKKEEKERKKKEVEERRKAAKTAAAEREAEIKRSERERDRENFVKERDRIVRDRQILNEERKFQTKKREI